MCARIKSRAFCYFLLQPLAPWAGMPGASLILSAEEAQLMLKRYSREPSVTSSVTFAEMTGKSVIYFKGVSCLIEAQKLQVGDL